MIIKKVNELPIDHYASIYDVENNPFNNHPLYGACCPECTEYLDENGYCAECNIQYQVEP